MTQHPCADRDQLFEALELFSKSPRFSLLKGVQVSRLMPEGGVSVGGVGDLTFEQLLGQLRAGGDTIQLPAAAAQALRELLRALSEDTSESFSESVCGMPDDASGKACADSFGGGPIPTLDGEFQRFREEQEYEDDAGDVPVGSVPLELALRARLTTIASHRLYEQVRSRKIGEFWDSAWTPAPFEEAMSIEQLVGLDLAVLFKKRMVTDTRIQSILRALQRVLDLLERGDTVECSNHAQSKDTVRCRIAMHQEVQQSSRTLKRDLSGVVNPGGCPTHLPLSIEALAVWEVINNCDHESSIVTATLQEFSPEQCVALVLDLEVSPIPLRKLTSIVTRLLPSHVCDLVRALLRSPGVCIDHIALVVDDRQHHPSAFLRCLAVLVARALGAVPVVYEGKVCPGFWTLQPQLMQAIAHERVAFARTGRRPARSETLHATALDPILQQWIDSQGVGKKTRNGTRNHMKRRRRKGS